MSHIVQYPMPKATNKVNTTDSVNKTNAICFSVKVMRAFVAATVVGLSCSLSCSLTSAACTLDCNVLCLTSVKGLNSWSPLVVAFLTALTLASMLLLAGREDAV